MSMNIPPGPFAFVYIDVDLALKTRHAWAHHNEAPTLEQLEKAAKRFYDVAAAVCMWTSDCGYGMLQPASSRATLPCSSRSPYTVQ